MFRPSVLCAASVSSAPLWLTWPKNTAETQRTQRLRREIYPTFRNFREFGRAKFSAKGSRTAWGEMELAVCSLHLVLKPDRDSTTNRPSIVTDDGQGLTVLITRLRVKQVARVEYGFGSNGQSKTRQLLRDLNTQRWIVNT